MKKSQTRPENKHQKGKRTKHAQPRDEEARRRAYELYETGSWRQGRHLDDWFDDERELMR